MPQSDVLLWFGLQVCKLSRPFLIGESLWHLSTLKALANSLFLSWLKSDYALCEASQFYDSIGSWFSRFAICCLTKSKQSPRFYPLKPFQAEILAPILWHLCHSIPYLSLTIHWACFGTFTTYPHILSVSTIIHCKQSLIYLSSRQLSHIPFSAQRDLPWFRVWHSQRLGIVPYTF